MVLAIVKLLIYGLLGMADLQEERAVSWEEQEAAGQGSSPTARCGQQAGSTTAATQLGPGTNSANGTEHGRLQRP